MSPESTLPGPNSTNVVTPPVIAWRMQSHQRTDSVTWHSIASLMAAGSLLCGAPLTLASTGRVGARKAMSAMTSASLARAEAMSGEWKAPATFSGMALTPSSAATVAAAATPVLRPESTTCASELMLATERPALSQIV